MAHTLKPTKESDRIPLIDFLRGIIIFGLIINGLRYYQWNYEDHLLNISKLNALLFTFSKEILGIGYILILNGVYLKKIKVKIFTKIGKTAL